MRGPSRTVRRADALAWMAERLFEPGDTPALAPDRHEIVVHVEADVLADGRAGRCEIEHGTAIAAETARRLCCDAGIVPVVDGPNGEPLSVGRRTRSIPPAVRRALANRDRGCRFPGCPATQRLYGHHVKHWAEGGETSFDNLVLLCPTHHRLVHEGGFDVERLDDGAFRFTNPHGLAIRLPTRHEISSPDTIVVRNASLGLAIDCETATAHWHGERIFHAAPRLDAARVGTLRRAAGDAEGRQARRGRDRRHGGRGGPLPAARRPVAEGLRAFRGRCPGGDDADLRCASAAHGLGRRVRPHLRILPGRVLQAGGARQRRVLHAALDRPDHRERDRAGPRRRPRPRLRLGRDVRAVEPLHRGRGRGHDEAGHVLRPREERDHREARPGQPRRTRAGGQDPRRQRGHHLLRPER